MSIDSSETAIDAALRRMARDWYGYGWWEATCWFIGPEPGRPEKEDTLRKRCEAWIRIGSGELVDCKSHHFGFGWYDWHREAPPPHTQPTWRQLIRLLLALRSGRPPELEDIRSYQQRCWGMRKNEQEGETCAIELCSLAAPALKFKKNVPFDPNCFIGQRSEVIRARIQTYKPKLVVFYGLGHREQYQRIAGCAFGVGQPVKMGSTCVVLTPHPVSLGLGKSYWLELAARLRRNGCF